MTKENKISLSLLVYVMVAAAIITELLNVPVHTGTCVFFSAAFIIIALEKGFNALIKTIRET